LEGGEARGWSLLMRTFLILFLLLFAVPVHAKSGVRLTSDDLAILVSKDVNGQRWAINLSLSPTNPLTVTGNVFTGDGEPAFLYCQAIDVVGSADDIAHALFTWNCFGAPRCEVGNCPDWTFISAVTLPGSFFLP
jgi:hypothetical protein